MHDDDDDDDCNDGDDEKAPFHFTPHWTHFHMTLCNFLWMNGVVKLCNGR
jgi:hypothetical protein